MKHPVEKIGEGHLRYRGFDIKKRRHPSTGWAYAPVGREHGARFDVARSSKNARRMIDQRLDGVAA